MGKPLIHFTKIYVLLICLFLQASLAEASPTSFRRNTNWGNYKRSYLVNIPPKKRPGPYPVLIALHGGGGTGAGLSGKTGYGSLPSLENVIVILPDGYSKRWNDGRERGNIPADVDDVGFISSIIDYAVSTLGADAGKVFVVGHSNGSMMALRLSCEIGTRLAGIGVISGSLPTLIAPTCNPGKALPAMFINGTDDPSILYNGGCVGGASKTDSSGKCKIGSTVSVETTVKFFQQLDGCTLSAQTWTLKDKAPRDNSHIDSLLYTGCSSNAPIKLYRVIGGGHSVPGVSGGAAEGLPLGNTNMDTNGWTEVWGFFRGLYKVPAPTISAKCVKATKTVTLTWKPIIGATGYLYRIDRASPSWTGNCDSGDNCGAVSPVANSVSLPVVSGQKNLAWAHALAGANGSPPSKPLSFICR